MDLIILCNNYWIIDGDKLTIRCDNNILMPSLLIMWEINLNYAIYINNK